MQCIKHRIYKLKRSGENIFTCLRVSGEDRLEFLQGQLTQNVAALAESGTLPAAWCSPKGRVIVTARLIANKDSIALILPSDGAEAVLKRLSMYRLRSKVEILPDPELRSLAIATSQIPDALPGHARDAATSGVTVVPLTAAVSEVLGTDKALQNAGIDPSLALSNAQWRAARIEAGWVDIDAGNTETYTPHMVNLDRVGAISFNKGCYTGQEVVARTENLGRVKRRANRYGISGFLAAVGDKLTDGQGDAGVIVNAAEDQFLAVVPVDRHNDVLAVNGHVATPLPLPYSGV